MSSSDINHVELPHFDTMPGHEPRKAGALALIAILGGWAGYNIADTDQPNVPQEAVVQYYQEQEDLNEVQRILAAHEQATPLSEIWRAHAADTDNDIANRLTHEGIASQMYGLTFSGDMKAAENLYGTLFDDLERAADPAAAIAVANKEAQKLGFQYKVPQSPISLSSEDPSDVAIPLAYEDVSLGDLRDWLGRQILDLKSTPIELINYSQLKTVYLVNGFSKIDAPGMVLPERGNIYINPELLEKGEDRFENGAQMYSIKDRNIFAHEVGHLVHYRLEREGLLDNERVWQLATQKVATSGGGECFLLGSFDRADAAIHPAEATAAIIARLLRGEPLAPKDRTGLELSSAYTLATLGRALPEVDIVDYFIAANKRSNDVRQDEGARLADERWQACIHKPTSTPTTAPAQ